MSLTPVPVALKALLDSVPGPTPAQTLALAVMRTAARME